MKVKRFDVLKRINKYIKKTKKEIIALILVSMLTIPVAFISPYFFSILIDKVMAEGQIKYFAIVVVGLIGVYIIRLLLDSANIFCSNRILNRFLFCIRKDIWTKYLKLSFGEYEKMGIGDLKMRLVDDADGIGNFIKDQVVDYIFSIGMVIVSLLITLYINYKLTLLCLLIMPFVIIINSLIGRGNKKVNEKIRKVNEEYFSFLHNTLQYWKEIKAQCTEINFIERFKTFRMSLASLGYNQIRYWGFSEIFTDFKTNYLTKVMVYIIGSYFVIKGDLSVGLLILFSESFGMLFTNLDVVNSRSVALSVSMPYYTRICEALDFIEEDEQNKHNIDLKGDIKISNVEFFYDEKSKKILDDVSLEIKNGDYVAVVGKSGCGKTTLMKVMLNLYKPQSGMIEIDGTDIKLIKKKCLYSQIGVVMQDNYLFNMSIIENLLLSKSNATLEELQTACKQANIMDFINTLPLGFDTVIGERGVKLSGGQKQRIAIAQALLKKPKLILFDEATSSVDKISEDIINRSISEIANKTTVIVISHKPSTIIRAKRIVMVEEGKITTDSEAEGLKGNRIYANIAG